MNVAFSRNCWKAF